MRKIRRLVRGEDVELCRTVLRASAGDLFYNVHRHTIGRIVKMTRNRRVLLCGKKQ